MLPVADACDPDQGVLARRACARDGDGRRRRRTATRCAARSASSSAGSRSRDDARVLARPERYLDTYWRRFPGIWTHGDWASVDEDGYWFLHGRSDDTLNIAGKRIGPAELESAAVGHPSVAEAAAIGVPHEVKGEVAWIFCVVTPGTEADEALAAEVAAEVVGDLGKAFKPDRVIFVSALPKTRSAKIVRRAGSRTGARLRPGRPLVPGKPRIAGGDRKCRLIVEQHSSPEADAESARASPASSRRTAGRSSSPPGAATRSTRWRTRSAAVRSSSTCPDREAVERAVSRDGRRRAARGQRRRQRSGRRDLGDRSRGLVARPGDQRPRRPPLLPNGDPRNAASAAAAGS